MEKKPEKIEEIIKDDLFNTTEWQENITILDLSNKDLLQLDKNVKLPSNLVVLNLSRNKFEEVPLPVLKLENLKTLDISYNSIVLFDNTPNFCNSVEHLNLNNNALIGPPYWVWSERPKHLVQLDLSNNANICNSFQDNYLEDLLQYTTLVTKIDLQCCRLRNHIKLMTTFRHAKIVILGSKEYLYHSDNHLENVPCAGLEDCCDVEILNICNTHIYNVQHNIDIYQNLIDINLSQNNINSLPNEFCNLKNLQICILSVNKILYLPDDMYKLTKLIKLYLDNNELCMLPPNLHQIEGLKTLDLYNNHLYEGPIDISNLEQYDFAQNYANEPQDKDYLLKKESLRQKVFRLDGSLPEVVEIEYDKYEDDDDFCDENYNQNTEQEPQLVDSRSSSPEDWDSDKHWIPSVLDIDSHATPLHRRQGNSNIRTTMKWLEFVKRKMKEGNFCPMDMHLPVSITDKVKYEKMCNPDPQYESDGQFDDYSADET